MLSAMPIVEAIAVSAERRHGAVKKQTEVPSEYPEIELISHAETVI